MEVNGYVRLNKDAKCTHAMGDPEIWQGKTLRAFEINEKTKSVLLIDSSATQMGMFDMSEVQAFFHCKDVNGVLVPPELDLYQSSHYSMKIMNRKGGYNNTLKQMVVVASLSKGKLCDDFLLQNQ